MTPRNPRRSVRHGGWVTMPDSGWPEWSLSSVLGRRPTVRVNQIGYLPHGPKQATWVTDVLLPAEFSIVAADGSVVLRRHTEPWPNRPDATSGQSVQVVDFSGLTATGTG